MAGSRRGEANADSEGELPGRQDTAADGLVRVATRAADPAVRSAPRVDQGGLVLPAVEDEAAQGRVVPAATGAGPPRDRQAFFLGGGAFLASFLGAAALAF